MPLLWRYLLAQYLRVLCLCTVSFIALLLIMRIEEIAHFATLGGGLTTIGWFILYQIPYILPIAIPISSLISITLLIQHLSHSFELTAFRSCGMSLRDILTPLLFISVLLSIGSFYVVSEVATQSHLAAGQLKSKLRSLNPLLLLHNKQFARIKGLYFDVLGASRLGDSASDIVLSMPNKKNQRLNLLIAQNVSTGSKDFHGEGVTLITSLEGDQSDQFDHLMIENIGHISSSVKDFSQAVHRKVWTLNNDHLRLPLLYVKLQKERDELNHAEQSNLPTGQLKQLQRNLNRGYAEILRRLSIALATFTFTIMGAAFAINISRKQTNRRLYYVIGLAALYLIAYFSGKAMEHVLATAAILYLVPHLIILYFSFWNLRRVTGGRE